MPSIHDILNEMKELRIISDSDHVHLVVRWNIDPQRVARTAIETFDDTENVHRKEICAELLAACFAKDPELGDKKLRPFDKKTIKDAAIGVGMYTQEQIDAIIAKGQQDNEASSAPKPK